MSSSYPMTEREFEQMLELSIANGVVSPHTIREKLSQNYGRYMAMYRNGPKKGSPNPNPVQKTEVKKDKVVKNKQVESNDSVRFDFLDESLAHINVADEKEAAEIHDLAVALSKESMVPTDQAYVVSQKQKNKDDVLFSVLKAKKVSFIPLVASQMRRKGNQAPSDQVIAMESVLGMHVFLNACSKKKPEEFGTIGAEVADWLSDLPSKDQKILKPFVRVPKLLKGFFREPEIRKKSKA